MLEAAPYLASKAHDAGFYPLDVAILTGDLSVFELIASQPNVDFDGRETAKDCLADNPGLRNSLLLLEFCADATVKPITDATPLHYACLLGNLDVMKAVVLRCASFEKLDSKGWPPFMYFRFKYISDLDCWTVFRAAQNEHLRLKVMFGSGAFISSLQVFV